MITQNPDTSTPVTPNELIRHLWSRRWLMILGGPVFFLAIYGYIRFFMGETFEATATLMLRTPPSVLRDGPKIDRIEPPALPGLLQSDELVHEVIVAARAKFPSDFAEGRFEEARKAFAVKTVMTRDTTVQATYSPAVTLSARGPSREAAYFLINEWLTRSIDRIGNLRSREAKALQDAATVDYARFAANAADLSARQTELELRRDELDALHFAKQELLLGAAAVGASRGYPSNQTNPREGLVAERSRLEVEGASLNSDSTNPSLAQSAARLAATDQQIARQRADLDLLRADRSAVRNDLEAVRRDLLLARERMAQMRSIIAMATADATKITDPGNNGATGDLLLIAKPVMPELRIAPKRTTLALGGTLFLMTALIFLIVLELYLRRAVVGDRAA